MDFNVVAIEIYRVVKAFLNDGKIFTVDDIFNSIKESKIIKVKRGILVPLIENVIYSNCHIGENQYVTTSVVVNNVSFDVFHPSFQSENYLRFLQAKAPVDDGEEISVDPNDDKTAPAQGPSENDLDLGSELEKLWGELSKCGHSASEKFIESLKKKLVVKKRCKNGTILKNETLPCTCEKCQLERTVIPVEHTEMTEQSFRVHDPENCDIKDCVFCKNELGDVFVQHPVENYNAASLYLGGGDDALRVEDGICLKGDENFPCQCDACQKENPFTLQVRDRLIVPSMVVNLLNNKSGSVMVIAHKGGLIEIKNWNENYTAGDGEVVRKYSIDKSNNIRLSNFIVKTAFSRVIWGEILSGTVVDGVIRITY